MVCKADSRSVAFERSMGSVNIGACQERYKAIEKEEIRHRFQDCFCLAC